MTKAELVETLRNEAREIEKLITKMQERCNQVKLLAEHIENSGKKRAPEAEEPPSKFRKAIDKVFGEKR